MGDHARRSAAFRVVTLVSLLLAVAAALPGVSSGSIPALGIATVRVRRSGPDLPAGSTRLALRLGSTRDSVRGPVIARLLGSTATWGDLPARGLSGFAEVDVTLPDSAARIGLQIELPGAADPLVLPFELPRGSPFTGAAQRLGSAGAPPRVASAPRLHGVLQLDGGLLRLALLDDRGAILREVPLGPAETAHDLAWNGDTFGALFDDGRGLVLAQVRADGSAAGTQRLAGRARTARIAWNEPAGAWAVAAERNGPAGPEIVLVLLDARGLPREERVLASSGSNPRIASSGARWGVAWDGAAGLAWFGVLDANGRWIAPPLVAGAAGPLALSGTGGARFAVAVARGVASGAGLAIRVSSVDGLSLGPVSIVGAGVPAVAVEPCAAAGDGRLPSLLAWIDAWGGVRLVEIDRDGVGVVTSIPGIAPESATAVALSAALLAWNEPASDVDAAALWVRPLGAAASTASGAPAGTGPAPDTPAFSSGTELCNGVDDDGDGAVDEERGDRFVASAGSDTDNACTSPAAPCATLGQAIRAACTGETVRVAEGSYVEDVVVDKAVAVASQGLGMNTILRGTGATDVVRILAGGVRWNAITVRDTPGRACVRVGDAHHPGLRDVQITNTSVSGCAVGVVFDGTGVEDGLPWNRILSSVVRGSVDDGSAFGGTGILAVGGNGRLEVKLCQLLDNDGAGFRVEPAPGASRNRTVVLAGDLLTGNAGHVSARSAGAVFRGVEDLRFEGNTVTGHTEAASGGDARAVWLEDVSGGYVTCNRLHGNADGLVLSGATTALDIAQNRFLAHEGAALVVEAGAGSGVAIAQNVFQGNRVGLRNEDASTLAARRNWWGAANGPAPAGGGDTVLGPVDTTMFIAQDAAPLLVRRPSDSGWEPSADGCYQSIQQAVDAAAPHDFVSVGPGTYYEHVLVTKPLQLEGEDGGAGCSPSAISGEQVSGSHLPALRIAGVAGVALKHLTLRNAGHGSTACGASSGDEIGLDLEDADSGTFRDLCLRDNGVTEIRVRGDSDGNLFERVTIDGMWRTAGGADPCGHRSRDGILIDGWPACEGGPGAIADGNRVTDSRISNVVRGVVVRLADGTAIAGNTIVAAKAPAWESGAYAASVVVELGDGTTITGNTMGAPTQVDGVRIGGRPPGSCAAERTGSRNTVVAENVITTVAGAAVRLWKPVGAGLPVDVSIECNRLQRNGIGVLAESVGELGHPTARVRHNDLLENTVGVRNVAIEPLDARSNWWGSGGGPSGAGSGNGDSVLGAAQFAAWLGSPARTDDDADSVTECQGDCDDSAPNVAPGAPERCANGQDDDCDAAPDGSDGSCAGLAVGGLRFLPGSRASLTWNSAPAATRYGLFRGSVPEMGFTSYNHVPMEAQLPTAGAVVTEVPAPRTALYYLATGQSVDGTGAVRSGPLGQASSGVWRPDVPASLPTTPLS